VYSQFCFFETNFNLFLPYFSRVLVDHLKGRFGIHPKQVKNLKVCILVILSKLAIHYLSAPLIK
jgi:hypothetical protein